MNQLTAKNGQSEWPYKGKTLIAVPEIKGCNKCVLRPYSCCLDLANVPSCLISETGFDQSIIYVKKPTEK